jgi:hypothetical protein
MSKLIFDFSPRARIWGAWAMTQRDGHWLMLCWEEGGVVKLKHRYRSQGNVSESVVETGTDPHAMIEKARAVAREFKDIQVTLARDLGAALAAGQRLAGWPYDKPPCTPEEMAAIPVVEILGPMNIDEYMRRMERRGHEFVGHEV